MKYIITELQYKKIISEMDEFPYEGGLEERKQEIIKRKQLIEKLIPKIIKYFKFKFKNNLENIEIENSSTHYGYEKITIEHPRINFYFNEAENGEPREIINDLKNVFNIDITEYAVPLKLRVMEKTWKKVWG